MKWRVVWGRKATNDIDAISEYIAKGSRRAAKRVSHYIRQAARPLAKSPRLGRAIDSDTTRELILVRYPYVLVYQLVDHEVRILAVFHQSQNRP
jgi:plasmid stabilization system protein ParE